VLNNSGRVWGGVGAPAQKKNSKYTKTENNLTADHELLPKEQSYTSDSAIYTAKIEE